MAISEKEYFEALRQADNRRFDELRLSDQRALDIAAASATAGQSRLITVGSLLVAILAVVVAVWSVVTR